MNNINWNKYISTLKEASYDKANNTYMTDSELPIFNFDKIKDDYIKELHCDELLLSNDVLFYDKEENEYYFIEFKDGVIDFKKRADIKFKLYDSLLIFLDIENKTIHYSRKHLNYILVYNPYKAHNLEARNIDIISGPFSKEDIIKHISKKGNQYIIKLGLEKYKGIYFKNVYTYTQEEFENSFLKQFI